MLNFTLHNIYLYSQLVFFPNFYVTILYGILCKTKISFSFSTIKFKKKCTKKIKTRHCKKVYSCACEGDRGGNVFLFLRKRLNRQNRTREILPSSIQVKVDFCLKQKQLTWQCEWRRPVNHHSFEKLPQSATSVRCCCTHARSPPIGQFEFRIRTF